MVTGERDYMLRGNTSTWFHQMTPGRVAEFRLRFGDDWCVVLYRSADEFYAIPFAVLKPFLTEATFCVPLPTAVKQSSRWVGHINEAGDYVLALGLGGSSVFVANVREYRYCLSVVAS